MSELATVGIDLAKSVSTFTVSTRVVGLLYVASSVEASCLRFSRNVPAA